MHSSLSGDPGILMEHVGGGSLDRAIRQGVYSRMEEALNAAAQVAAGLAHLHNVCEILHRDLKPENVLLSSGLGTEVKLTDFGVSKELGTDAEGASSDSGVETGAAAAGAYDGGVSAYFQTDRRYAPPEVVPPSAAAAAEVTETETPSGLPAAGSGTVVGAARRTPHTGVLPNGKIYGRSGDVYALGLTLYELLNARPAFAPARVLVRGAGAGSLSGEESEPVGWDVPFEPGPAQEAPTGAGTQVPASGEHLYCHRGTLWDASMRSCIYNASQAKQAAQDSVLRGAESVGSI